jgi:hypothetical protein
VQGVPVASRPTHCPSTHPLSAVQSSSVAQAVAQPADVQRYGAHAIGVGTLQAPCPLHTGAGTLDAASEQEPMPQVTPEDGYEQLAVETPSHCPPQTVPSAAHGARSPAGAPTGVGEHVPGEGIRLHAAH